MNRQNSQPADLNTLLRGEQLFEGSEMDRRQAMDRGVGMLRNMMFASVFAAASTPRNLDARDPKIKVKPMSKVELQNHVDKMIKDEVIVWASVEKIMAGETDKGNDDEPVAEGCSDGRYTKAQFAMFGGRLGLLPTQLAATEVASGKKIPDEKIPEIVKEELDLGHALCLHMDEAHGLEHFMKEMNIKTAEEARDMLKKFASGKLPPEIHQKVQKVLKHRGCVSCGHFAELMDNTPKYRGVRKPHVTGTYDAGIDQMGKGKKVKNAVLKGPHMEQYRLVTVATVESIKDLVPGVPGTYDGKSGFHISEATRTIENNDYADSNKKLTGIDVPIRDLRKALATLTDEHTAVTTTALDADDLPLYIGRADGKKKRIIIEEAPKPKKK